MFGVFHRQSEPGSSDPAPRYVSEPVVTAEAYNRLLAFMRVYGRTRTLSRADKALMGRLQALPVSWKNTLPQNGVFESPEMPPSRLAPLPIPGTPAMPVLSLGGFGMPGFGQMPGVTTTADVSSPDPSSGGLTW